MGCYFIRIVVGSGLPDSRTPGLIFYFYYYFFKITQYLSVFFQTNFS